MSTSRRQDSYIAGWIEDQLDLSEIDFSDLITDVIADEFEPEDVFDIARLEAWAEDNGWTKDG